MNYKKQIEEFVPLVEQEVNDKKLTLEYIEAYPQNVLLRENEIAHITSSGLILNKALDKMLMIHHNIYKTWAWTGGHADGDEDLLYIAIKEAREETGVVNLTPITNKLMSLDVLPVYGHVKKGKYVSTHLHLSAAYVLIADENEKLIIKEDENSGVQWIDVDKIHEYTNETYLINIYKKIIKRARELKY